MFLFLALDRWEKEKVCPTNVPKKMGHTFASKLLLLLPTSLAFFPLPLIQKTVSSLSIYLFNLYKNTQLPRSLIFIFIFIINFSISLFSSKANNQKLSFFLLQLFKKKDKSFEEMDQFVNLKETELRLGLPGTDNVCEEKKIVSCCNYSNKRALPSDYDNEIESSTRKTETSPPKK